MAARSKPLNSCRPGLNDALVEKVRYGRSGGSSAEAEDTAHIVATSWQRDVHQQAEGGVGVCSRACVVASTAFMGTRFVRGRPLHSWEGTTARNPRVMGLRRSFSLLSHSQKAEKGKQEKRF